MKNLTLILATTLMAATTAQTDEGSPLSYRDVSGRMSLTVSHAIDVHRPIASRNFSFDLALAMDSLKPPSPTFDNSSRATLRARWVVVVMVTGSPSRSETSFLDVGNPR